MNTNVIDTIRTLTSDERKANARRWGKLHGFNGAQGGWVYGPSFHRPIVQGWDAFFSHIRHRIIADVAAGTFTITRSRSKS